MRTVCWAAALLLLWGASARAADSYLEAGTGVVAGSGGYHKFLLASDGLWHTSRVDPYAWADWSTDNFVRELSIGGGVWKDLRDDLRVKGGAGFITGKIKDLSEDSNALLVEAGMEKDVSLSTLGAEDRLTSGSIVAPDVLRLGEQQVENKAHGRAPGPASPAPQSFVYNELSGYLKVLVGRDLLGLRVTWGLPDYARGFLDETVSLRVPLPKSFYVTPAVSFEEDSVDSVFFSVGLYYLFY